MFIKLLGSATVVAMAMTLGVLPAAAKKDVEDISQTRECKTTEVSRTGGRARSKLFARKKARDAWRQKIRETETRNARKKSGIKKPTRSDRKQFKKDGKKWASWLFSKNPTYNCFRERSRNRCTVKATPCKLAVVLSGPGKVCSFYKISATGKKAQLKGWAKHLARKTWAERVRNFYGNKMDTWLISNSKETTCKDLKDGKHVCTVISQPCRIKILN